MSLISDALRKAQAAPSPAPLKLSKTKNRWMLPVGLVLLAVGSLFALSRLNSADQSVQYTAKTNPILNLRGAESAWRLQGVVRGDKSTSLALIDGVWVEEGAQVRGAKLVRVDDSMVELEKEGRAETLSLR